ncbi:MAG: hypothetical protein WC825_08065 [Gallionellaceae bacterium]
MSLAPCVRCDVLEQICKWGGLYATRGGGVNETKGGALYLFTRLRFDPGVPPHIFDNGIQAAVKHVHHFVGMKDSVASLLGGGAQDAECSGIGTQVFCRTG